MLAPEDRRLYSACFAVPNGHVFDAALGTTYSLDLDCLLFALFCLATGGVEEPEAALGDPISLLEAIHRIGSRVTVFCHAGETNVPRRPQSLYGLIEPSLVPALGRGGAIFHPKLWLLRFRNTDTGQSLLRAVVLSRNLTTSRAWDAFVGLEGEPGGEAVAESGDLAALVRALPGLGARGHALSDERTAQLATLAADAERTRFIAPPPFEGTAAFEALGIGNGRRLEAHRGDQLLAVSPFVSPETLTHLRQLAPRVRLVGRAEEMAKCPAAVVGAWEAFTLHEGASADADSLTEPDQSETADAAPQGLHAKALAVESAQRTTWWLGSGNLTDPVRAGSCVELLVRLEGKTTLVGIEPFLASGFGSLLVPYQHTLAPEDAAERSRSRVERTKQRLAEADLLLRCEPRGELWDVLLAGPALELDGVDVACRLVTLGPSRELRWPPGASLRFEALSTEALSAFVVFRLSVGQGESLFELRFTLKLPITGLPLERDARIARSIIKDRAAFMSYLHCLLAELGDGLGASDLSPRAALRESGDATAATSSSGLLEALLRALHRDPRRLFSLRSLMAQTGTGAEDPLPIPDEVRELWSAIEPHLTASEAAQ